MKTTATALVVVALLALAPDAGLAQTVTKVGTTAAKFLSIPVGARAVGMGGAFVGVADDATAMYWNVAGIARMYQAEAVFAHASWVADIKFNYGGVVIPVGDLGSVGVNFTSMSMAEMERTTELQPEGTGTTFTASSFALGVAYARNLTDWFSIGANFKYIREGIYNSSASGIAIDIGTLFTTPFPGLNFGAGISNFGDKLTMTGSDLLVQKDISPVAGNNSNVNANLSTEAFDIPLILRIGFAYEPIADDNQRLIICLDAAHPNDNAEYVNVGGEYSFLDRIISLRVGYRSVLVDWKLAPSESEEKFTLGGGLRYMVAGSVGVKFDYAFEKFGRLENVHKFALGILF